MQRALRRPRGGSSSASSSPASSSVSSSTSQAAPNRPDRLPERDDAPLSMLDALAACFGPEARDVSVRQDDATLDALGADAATVDGEVHLPGGFDLEAPDRDGLDLVGHEWAHALGSTSGEVDVDEEGDVAEAAARDAGAGFASWVASGCEGPAPQLQAATGGRGRIQRRHTGRELTGRPMLSRGSQGSLVVLLQQRLNEEGARLRVDGDFGPKTDRAVRRFQSRMGLLVDGLVGPRTAAELEKVHHYEPAPQEGGGEDREEDGPMLSGRPMLERGARGRRVRTLQDLLSTAGFRTAVDGDFGPATERSVRAYQRSRGLGVDGIVGPETARALSTNAPSRGPSEDAGGGSALPPGERKSFDPANRLGRSEMNPTVVRQTEAVCTELQDRGYHPYVVSGFRSFSEQNHIYEQGRSRPGPKVTWVRGGGSWHNYGLAVDIAFWNSSGSAPSWSEGHPWHLIGEVGLKNGFTRWGGDFGDRPHLEHHPRWGSGASSLASTYHREGLPAVWKKVGA